ncbi:MAG: hypothetical protein Q9217_001796 [Psora testacea]
MSYGSPQWQRWVLDEQKAVPLLLHAFERGINTWDTADIYSNGRSEEIIAKALAVGRIPREKVVLLSKCYFGVDKITDKQPFIPDMSLNYGDLVNQVGLSRKHILDAVESSVKRLGTYIDVLQIHRLDPETPREEIMGALNSVVEKGLVRYIGASTMPAWEYQGLQNVARAHNWHTFISMQNYYNLLYREEEREMLPYCRHEKIGCLAWSPLARGILTRPWKSGASARESSDDFLGSFVNRSESSEEIVRRLEAIASKKGTTMAIIAIAWSLSKEGVNPIVGLNSKSRIDEMVVAVGFVLTEAEIRSLEEPYLPLPIAGYA